MERKIKEIEDIAKLDIYRDKKCGIPEVILAEGKEPKWVVKLLFEMAKAKGVAVATRVDTECFKEIKKRQPQSFKLKYYEKARMAVITKINYKIEKKN